MTDFKDKLSSLVSLEMSAGTIKDPEKGSAMIEALASSLAFTVALVAKGDDDAINTLLDGMTMYIYETAAERAPLAKMIAAPRNVG